MRTREPANRDNGRRDASAVLRHGIIPPLLQRGIKHNKDFELLVIPGGGHGKGGAYGEHKRFDFFTRHLLGQTPPEWKALEDTMKKGTATTASRR